MTSVILTISFTFANSSLMHTNFDQSSKVCFEFVEKFEPCNFFFVKNEPKCSIKFCCNLSVVEKLINSLVHYCCFEAFYCIIGNFVSLLFKFRIHRELFHLNAPPFLDNYDQVPRWYCRDQVLPLWKTYFGVFFCCHKAEGIENSSKQSWHLEVTSSFAVLCFFAK